MMGAHWRYLKYLCRHKWFVFIAGCRLGIPFLALMHDNSKFLPSEWFAYVAYFYGGERQSWADVPAGVKWDFGEAAWKCSKEGVQEAFDLAWLHHEKRNKHHWQRWVLQLDDGGSKCLPMPDRYRREMLADWIGAGRAISGRRDPAPWYLANKDKIQLHPATREWIERQMGIAVSPLEAVANGAK